MYFAGLRTTPWAPQFTWVATPAIAADSINRPHEDYPKRVGATMGAIKHLDSVLKVGVRKKNTINPRFLTDLHEMMFPDIWGHGVNRYRTVNVTVGDHRAPDWELVPRLMLNLHDGYKGTVRDVEVLKMWYWDFETIHPFVDGNGRTAGVAVACFANMMEPEKGYLAALQ